MAKKAEAVATPAAPAEVPASSPPPPAPAPAAAPAKKPPFQGRGGWTPPKREPTGRPRGRPRKNPPPPTPAARAAPVSAPKADESVDTSSAVGWWVLAGTVVAAAVGAAAVYLTRKVRFVVHSN